LVAVLGQSTIDVRLVDTLQLLNVIKLSPGLEPPFHTLLWSPSSRFLLVATSDQIHIFSSRPDDKFHAVIRNPAPPGAKPVFISFGPTDLELCVCSSYGMKFALFNLKTSKSVEINNPKFFSATAARKGFAFGARSHHLALLTRSDGKDIISIHHPSTRDVQRSWAPDMIDSQGLVWSPDGRWLVSWESPAQGHRVLFYTPDGHLFKQWTSPTPLRSADDISLGAGVRFVQFSPDSNHLVIADSSRCICVFDMSAVGEAMRLQHPISLIPRDTLQVPYCRRGLTNISAYKLTEHADMARTGCRIECGRSRPQLRYGLPTGFSPWSVTGRGL
jgi:WD40 repeat protein